MRRTMSQNSSCAIAKTANSRMRCAQAGRKKRTAAVAVEAKTAPEGHEEGCACPYCEGPLVEEASVETCRKCDVEFVECPSCRDLNRKGAETCVHCGEALEN